MRMRNTYVNVKKFNEIWDDRYVEDTVTSVTAVDGSMMTSYFVVTDLAGLKETKDKNVYTLTGTSGTKVLKVYVNSDGSKHYKQYILK